MKKIYLISYPKSGRTWLRVLIGKYFNLIDNKNNIMKNNIIKVTHDDSSWSIKLLHYQNLNCDKSKYEKQNIIFLIRNIHDILISSYYHVTKRDKLYNDTISNFIRDDYYGVIKIIHFYNIWWKNKDISNKFTCIGYEDLRLNTFNTFKDIILFINNKDINIEYIKESIEYSKFENMRKLEEQNKLKHDALKPIDINDINSFKVRKGKINGYLDELSKDDINYINEQIFKHSNKEMYNKWIKSLYTHQ